MNIRYLLKTFIIFTLLLFLFEIKTSAANITFSDYSSISELDNKYSYGTIFCTENTNFEPLCEVEIQENDFIANANEDLIVKITNCAVDEDNDLCDVIVTIDNTKHFYGENYRNKLRISYSTVIDNIEFSTSHVGEVIFLVVPSIHSEKDIKLDYYKAGTDIKANINGICGMVLNINIPAATGASWIRKPKPTSGFCYGNEAVTSLYDAKIYWDSSSSYISINNEFNALECPKIYREGSFKDNTCLIVQDEKASFKVKYGGIDCGLVLAFASPYKFTDSSPEIKIDKNEVFENEEFNVELYQYVPNNYYSSLITFINNNNILYSSFKLEAIVNSCSIKNIGQPVILNESNQDISYMFDIAINNGKIEAILKSEYLNSKDFYNHLYILKFPVSYLENNTNLNMQDFSIKGLTTISNIQKDAGTVQNRVKKKIFINEYWNDNNNIDLTRAVSSNISIYSGENLIDSFSLNEENLWKVEKEVYKYDENGNILEYRIVKENPQPDYNMWINGLDIYNDLKCLIKVNYIDEYSNIRILDQTLLTGIANESTNIELKEFSGYKVDNAPELNVIFDRKEKEINIYYKRQLPELPVTGGSGYYFYTIIGSIFLFIGIIIKRRKI